MPSDPTLGITDRAFPARGASPAALTSQMADLARAVKFLTTSKPSLSLFPTAVNGSGGLNWSQNFTIQRQGSIAIIFAQASAFRTTVGNSGLGLRLDNDPATDVASSFYFSTANQHQMLPPIIMVTRVLDEGLHSFLYFTDGTLSGDANDRHVGLVLELAG